MGTQRDTRSDLSPRKVAERLKEEGKQRLERGKTSAADQVEQVASALKSASNELGTQSPLATYANQLADSVGRFGARLREGSIEDLASSMQLAARRNPTLFVVGGLALGIVLARLVKASTDDESYIVEGDYDDLTAGSESETTYRGVQTPDAPTVDVTSGEYGSPGSSTKPFGG